MWRNLLAAATVVMALGGCAQEVGGPYFGGGPGSGGAPAYVTSYALVFESFTAREMLALEDEIRRFPGYRSHRSMGTTGMVHRYWYESAIGSADLNRALVLATDGHGFMTRIAISGNEYRVQKTGRR